VEQAWSVVRCVAKGGGDCGRDASGEPFVVEEEAEKRKTLSWGVVA